MHIESRHCWLDTKAVVFKATALARRVPQLSLLCTLFTIALWALTKPMCTYVSTFQFYCSFLLWVACVKCAWTFVVSKLKRVFSVDDVFSAPARWHFMPLVDLLCGMIRKRAAASRLQFTNYKSAFSLVFGWWHALTNSPRPLQSCGRTSCRVSCEESRKFLSRLLLVFRKAFWTCATVQVGYKCKCTQNKHCSFAVKDCSFILFHILFCVGDVNIARNGLRFDFVKIFLFAMHWFVETSSRDSDGSPLLFSHNWKNCWTITKLCEKSHEEPEIHFHETLAKR